MANQENLLDGISWNLTQFDSSGDYRILQIDEDNEITQDQFVNYLIREPLNLIEYPGSPGNVIIIFPIEISRDGTMYSKTELYPISSLRTKLDLVAAIEQWYSQPLFNNIPGLDGLHISSGNRGLDLYPNRFDILSSQYGFIHSVIMISPGIYLVDFDFS